MPFVLYEGTNGTFQDVFLGVLSAPPCYAERGDALGGLAGSLPSR